MSFVTIEGVARLRLPNGGEWHVNADDLNFEEVLREETKNGQQVMHEATFHLEGRANAPGGVWSVWEEPEGVFNTNDFSPLNGAVLIKDFVFGIELDPEDQE